MHCRSPAACGSQADPSEQNRPALAAGLPAGLHQHRARALVPSSPRGWWNSIPPRADGPPDSPPATAWGCPALCHRVYGLAFDQVPRRSRFRPDHDGHQLRTVDDASRGCPRGIHLSGSHIRHGPTRAVIRLRRNPRVCLLCTQPSREVPRPCLACWRLGMDPGGSTDSLSVLLGIDPGRPLRTRRPIPLGSCPHPLRFILGLADAWHPPLDHEQSRTCGLAWRVRHRDPARGDHARNGLVPSSSFTRAPDHRKAGRSLTCTSSDDNLYI